MRPSLIVADFDKTLIPFDSFRKFILLWLNRYPVRIACYIVLRKLRLIGAGYFKGKIVKLVSDHPQFVQICDSFVNSICKEIDVSRVNKIRDRTSIGTHVLLLSASPQIYMGAIGKVLGFEVKGSYFESHDNFIHLHGA